MDYVSIMSEAWRVTRGSRVLRGLGAISAAQMIVYSVVLSALLVPMTVLPQLTASLAAAAQAEASGNPLSDSPTTRLLSEGGQALLGYLPAVMVGVLALFGVWIALGVLDIAAQGGMIAEVDGALSAHRAGVRERMRAGFRTWWRVAGLSAVAAMPVLLVLLAGSLVTLFTFSLPLFRGEMPNPIGAVIGQVVLVPLQGIASLATVALGVLAQISLRYAVLDDLDWRRSLGHGTRLVRANIVHVALTYLLATAITAGVTSAATVAVGVVVGVSTGVVVLLAAAAPAAFGPTALVVAALGALVLTVGGLILYSLVIAWISAVWTVLFRRLTVSAETVLRPDYPSPHLQPNAENSRS